MTTQRTKTQNIKLIAGLILFILIIILIAQNLATVELTLLFWEVDISLFLLTSLNLVGGFILGWLFVTRKQKKRDLK